MYKAYRNLLGACISFSACYGSFNGMLNLQSSINAHQGLGLASSATIYGLAILTKLFVAGVLVRILGSKYSSCIGYGLHLFYIVANYYPSWYTLIPGSAICGIANGIMWVSIEVHLSESARRHATLLNKSPNNLIGLFMGVLIFSVKAGQVYGGLTSSIVLFTFTPNVTDEEDNFNSSSSSCTNTEALYTEQDYLYYILVSIYFTVTIFGVMTALIVMDSYPTDAKFVSYKKWFGEYFIKPLNNVLKVSLMWNMILLFPFLVVIGSTGAYFIGSFSNVYISECVGVRWVGFALTVFGIFSGIVSLVTGRLYKYVPTSLLFYTSIAISLAMSFFLIFWERSPSFIIVFVLSAGWGWVDGAGQTLGETLAGVLFPDHQEAAFSLYGIGVSLGFVFNFVLPIYFTTQIELSVYIVLVTLSSLTIFILLLKLSLMKRKKSIAKDDIKEKI